MHADEEEKLIEFTVAVSRRNLSWAQQGGRSNRPASTNTPIKMGLFVAAFPPLCFPASLASHS
jgi:hypothetical protein